MILKKEGRVIAFWTLIKTKVSFNMWCASKCGYGMYRFHFTCLFCRIRRSLKESLLDKLVFGSMKKDYINNTVMVKISQPVPIDGSIYILMINNRRKYARIKAAFLKRLLTMAEILAN